MLQQHDLELMLTDLYLTLTIANALATYMAVCSFNILDNYQ